MILPMIGQMLCCGLGELHAISNGASPQRNLWILCNSKWNTYNKNLNPFPSRVLFSGVIKLEGIKPDSDEYPANVLLVTKGATHLKSAFLFEQFLIKNELGRVVSLGDEYNVNYTKPRHLLRAYCWYPDQKALEAWWKAEQKKYGKLITDFIQKATPTFF